MREKVPNFIINKAVDIWCKNLLTPVFDNGDTSFIGGMSTALATINIQADKVAAGNMKARVEDFRKILTADLMRLRDDPMDGERFPKWLDVDYGPGKVLGDAANKAGIPHSQFSCKSSVAMYSNKVSVSFGYSASTTYYYPLPDGKWLLTSISADNDEMSKVITSVMNGNPLGLLVEGGPALLDVDERQTRLFQSLPLGTRFKYLDGTDVWVILERHGCGLVAKWDGIDGWLAGQSICSFADTPEECATTEVVLCEAQRSCE